MVDPERGVRLTLNDTLGLDVFQEPGIGDASRVTFEPGALPQQPFTYGDFSRGAGFMDHHAEGGYGYTRSMETWVPGLAANAGKLVFAGSYPIAGEWAGGFQWNRSTGSDLYLVGGRMTYKVTDGVGTPTLHTDIGPTAQMRKPVRFGSYIYIGVATTSTGDAYSLVRFDGTTFLNYDGNGGRALVPRHHLAVVYWDSAGVGSYRLIGCDTNYSFKSVASDPTVLANWTGATTVGNTDFAIRGLFTTNRHAYFMKSDGIYDVDARGYTPNLTPQWRDHYDYETGVAAVVMGGEAFTTHAYGLDRVPLSGDRIDQINYCQFGFDQAYHGEIYGRSYPLVNYYGWLVKSVYNRTLNTSFIMFGKPEQDKVRWYGSVAEMSGRVRFAVLHSPNTNPGQPSTTAPRLWFLSDNLATGEGEVYYLDMFKGQSWYQDYLSGESPTFATSASMYLADPFPDENGIQRVPERWECQADTLGSDRKIVASAALDGLNSYSQIATFTQSPRDKSVAGQGFDNAYRMDFKLEFTGSESVPVIMRAFRLVTDFTTDQSEIREYMIRIAHAGALPNMSQDESDPEIKWRALRNLTTLNAVPVNFRDEQNRLYKARVMQGVQRTPRKNRHGGYDSVASIRVKILYQLITWDAGFNYDTDEVWA